MNLTRLFVLILFFIFTVPGPVNAREDLLIRVLLLDKDETPPSGLLSYVGRLEGSLLVNGSSFQGSIEVWQADGKLYLINVMPLEEYVKGVVRGESGRDWPVEAYKVQAVIARTYAVYNMKKRNGLPFQITSNVMHQVFNGGPYGEDISRAVEETRGEILIYNGEPIEALYHSTSSDYTEDARDVFGQDYPYLRPVKVTANMSPYQKWKRIISLKDIERATGIFNIEGIAILSRTSTGRVRELGFKTPLGLRKIRATELRRVLGWQTLPSTAFEVSLEQDSIIFTGSGYGHGVGLSQWSSLDMILQGKTYREVLAYFYPGTELSKITPENK